MRETDQFYFFWRHQFGQWTLRNMTAPDGITYNCCEQYMMYQKATEVRHHFVDFMIFLARKANDFNDLRRFKGRM